MPWTRQKVFFCTSHLLRSIAILVGHDVLQHYVYIHMLASNPRYLETLPFPELIYVGGYEIMNFSAMYGATYRITQIVAEMDGFEVNHCINLRSL